MPGFFGTGVGIYFSLSEEPALMPLATVSLLAWIAVLLSKGRGVLWPFLLVALIASGLTTAKIRTDLLDVGALKRKVGPVELSGRVISVEAREMGARIVLEDLKGPELPVSELPTRIRISLRDGWQEIRPGYRVTVLTMLLPPARPAFPGGFDFARNAYFQGIGAVGFSFGKPLLVARAHGGDNHTDLATWLATARQSLSARVRGVLPGDTGALAAALMTGDRGAISPESTQAMRDAGLAHLLAISGLHLGLIAGLVFGGLRALFALLPFFALRAPIKKIAAVAAAPVAFSYLLLVGSSIPAERAFIMVLLALVAVLIDRSPISLRLVGAAALVVLFLRPESLVSASFQLSFAAVVALIAVFEKPEGRQVRAARQPGLSALGVPIRYLAVLSITSVVAIVATTPFALHHFGRFAVYGLLANLIAVPLMAFGIMPLVLCALLLAPFTADAWILKLMAILLELLLTVAHYVASLPGAVVKIPSLPTLPLVVIAVAGLWLCIWRRPWRYIALPIILLSLVAPLSRTLPDIIIDESADLVALRDPNGHYGFSTLRRQTFERQIWMEALGSQSVFAWDEKGDRNDWLSCDGLGCLYRKDGWPVAISFDGRGLEEDCRRAALVISLEPVRSAHCDDIPRDRLFDRFDFWRNGTHAFWLDAQRASVTYRTVESLRGLRPWSGGPD
ncbi:competence protein ComEC [Limibacillus sp. MBR-115]